MSETSQSNFLNNAEDIINHILNNKDFLLIKSKEGNVVLLPEEEYNKLKETQNKRTGD